VEHLAAAVAAADRERYRDTLARALSEGMPYDTDYVLEGADGLRRDIRESGRPILEDGQTARFIVTAQDVTEQVAATAALARKTAELEDLNRQKDKLFSIIAHDLRNPFNSVLGFADLLAAKSRELSPGKIATYAHMVRDAAAGVHDLIENLLVWGAYQIRDGALQCAPFHLGAAASEGLAPLMHMAEAKGVRIVNGIGAVQALGDEALVRIVFRNLVANAIKFSRHGGVVQVTAQVLNPGSDPAAADPMVRVTVRDDGVGIPASASAALFELGNAFSSPGTRGEKGTGLGLYLCRDIVCRHGGVISVDSAPGAGAAFNFTLPGIL
jgi:signal transduction histidine kinase